MTTSPPPAAPPDPAEVDPVALLKDKSYLGLLAIGAIIGVPVAAVAYFFLKVVAEAQQYLFSTLPDDLGFHGTPSWWPVPLLALSGFLVAAAIKYLPGPGGHSPADGFQNTGPLPPVELPGVVLAAFATLSLGVVLGPEAPLIAIGSGLGVLAVHLIKKDAPPMAAVVIGVAGSFAAVSTLLGSPIVGAFLLMEVAGLGGALLGVVLVPGLIAAGVGSLIFVGLDAWTGFGTFSLEVPKIPPAASPTGAEFLWAIAIGVAAGVLGAVIKRIGLFLRPLVARNSLVLTPVAGVAIGILVIIFVELTDKSFNFVLFSGQDALPTLIEGAAGWSAGALVLLIVCKGLAYGISLSSFRGGPVFPGLFIGAAGGIALSHLAGLPMIAGAAMGMGALTTAMLGLPLTSVLLTTLFLGSDGLTLMPVVIVAVAISYVASARLAPPASPEPEGAAAPAAPAAAQHLNPDDLRAHVAGQSPVRDDARAPVPWVNGRSTTAREVSVTPDERCEQVTRAIEATVSGDTSSVGELFTPDVIAWSPTIAVTSRVELAVELEDEDESFSDFEVATGPFVASSDRVCAEWVASATHADRSAGDDSSLVDAPERRVTVRGVTVAEFAGDRICAMRHYWNERELITGLGMPPDG